MTRPGTTGSEVLTGLIGPSSCRRRLSPRSVREYLTPLSGWGNDPIEGTRVRFLGGVVVRPWVPGSEVKSMVFVFEVWVGVPGSGVRVGVPGSVVQVGSLEVLVRPGVFGS